MNTFTNEEINILKNNTKQIIDFLIPLKKDIRDKYHTIEFGPNKYGSYHYSITLNPHTIYGSIGRCTLALEDNDKSCDYTLDNSYSAPDYMANLCHEWKSIKQKILSIVETERAITNSIRNFEL